MFEIRNIAAREIRCDRRRACSKDDRNRQGGRGGSLRRTDQVDRRADVAEIAGVIGSMVACRRSLVGTDTGEGGRGCRTMMPQGMDVAEGDDELNDKRKERRLCSEKPMSAEPLHRRPRPAFAPKRRWRNCNIITLLTVK